MSEQTFAIPISTSDAEFLAQLSDSAFWEHARALAHTESAKPVQLPDLLLCKLRSFSLLFPLEHILQVEPALKRYTRLPSMPDWMLGVLSWRGEILPLLDPAAYILNAQAHWQVHATMLVTQYAQYKLAWLVDSAELFSVPDSAQEPKASQSTLKWWEALPSGLIQEVRYQLPVVDTEILLNHAAQCIEAIGTL